MTKTSAFSSQVSPHYGIFVPCCLPFHCDLSQKYYNFYIYVRHLVSFGIVKRFNLRAFSITEWKMTSFLWKIFSIFFKKHNKKPTTTIPVYFKLVLFLNCEQVEKISHGCTDNLGRGPEK